MRYSPLLPDPTRLNVGFLKRDRVAGVGDWGDFWDSIGTGAINLGTSYAKQELGLNTPTPPAGSGATAGGGTPPAGGGTSGSASATPSWLWPAVIAGGIALIFFAQRK